MQPKFLLVLAIFTLSPLFMNSQTRFEKGYYVALDGNRVDCLIQNSNWSDSPNQVTYKIADSADESTIDPNSVLEFGVGGVVYKSVNSQFPETFLKPRKNDNEATPEMVQKTVFVKLILEGKASLYQYREKNQLIYLYQLDDEAIEVLNYKKYVTLNDYKIRENNLFRRQLLEKLNCNNSSAIQKVQYSRKSLTDYVLKFNSCKDPMGVVGSKEISRKKMKITVKLFAGVQSYDFTYESQGEDLDFENKTVAKFGAELEGILPFNNNKWSVFLSTDYSKYSSAIDAPNSATISYDIEVTRLGTLLGGRHYMFLDNKNSFFIEAALAFDKDFNSEVNEYFENEFFGDRVIPVREMSFGGSFGAGYSYNQSIYVKVNYYPAQSILRGQRTGNELSRLALTLSFRL
ncbi:hypothetical protein [Flagellimonas flava]|uniref:hypothetical protein n=1 Tax=Flagellimonas flava TaxID=570519 RepID=UPI003D65B518